MRVRMKHGRMVAPGIAGMLSLFAVHAPISAQAEGNWTLGLAGGVETPVLRDQDAEVSPFPLVTYQNEWLSVGTTGVEVTPFQWEGLSVSALLGMRSSEIEGADGDFFAGMDRKISGEMGLNLTFEGRVATVSATVLDSFTGAHGGYEVSVEVSREFDAGKWSFEPAVGARYQSSALGTYLYGVRGSEARAGRPEYSVDGAVTPFAEVTVSRMITERWAAFGSISGETLPETVRDSPLVDADASAGVSIGVLYRW